MLQNEGAAQRAAMVTEESSGSCGTGRAQGEADGMHQTLHNCSTELHGFYSTLQLSGGLLVATSSLEVASPRVPANLPF